MIMITSEPSWAFALFFTLVKVFLWFRELNDQRWRDVLGTVSNSVESIRWRRQWRPTQCSCLENPRDGGAWWAAVHGVAKSRTWPSDFTFTFHLHALEKERATHSSVLVWRIPGTGDPGGLPSRGSHRVGHDWSDLAAAESIRRGRAIKNHQKAIGKEIMGEVTSGLLGPALVIGSAIRL